MLSKLGLACVKAWQLGGHAASSVLLHPRTPCRTQRRTASTFQSLKNLVISESVAVKGRPRRRSTRPGACCLSRDIAKRFTWRSRGAAAEGTGCNPLTNVSCSYQGQNCPCLHFSGVFVPGRSLEEGLVSDNTTGAATRQPRS